LQAYVVEFGRLLGLFAGFAANHIQMPAGKTKANGRQRYVKTMMERPRYLTNAAPPRNRWRSNWQAFYAEEKGATFSGIQNYANLRNNPVREVPFEGASKATRRSRQLTATPP
jgi:hypothetical protein